MPIEPKNVTDYQGICYALPFVAINKATTNVITTPFGLVFAAIHINATSAAVVAVSSAAGSAAITTGSIANAGTLLVWGSGTGAATVTLG